MVVKETGNGLALTKRRKDGRHTHQACVATHINPCVGAFVAGIVTCHERKPGRQAVVLEDAWKFRYKRAIFRLDGCRTLPSASHGVCRDAQSSRSSSVHHVQPHLVVVVRICRLASVGVMHRWAL